MVANEVRRCLGFEDEEVDTRNDQLLEHNLVRAWHVQTTQFVLLNVELWLAHSNRHTVFLDLQGL